MDRDIAIANEEFGSNRQEAFVGEATADILDVLVHAEDLVNHQYEGMRPLSRGARAIGGNRAIRHTRGRHQRR